MRSSLETFLSALEDDFEMTADTSDADPVPLTAEKTVKSMMKSLPPTPTHSRFAISMNFERSSLKCTEILRKFNQNRFEKLRF